MKDALLNILSGAIGALITGGLGFIVLQQQFREQTRQRKRVVYAELIAELHHYVNATNSVVLRAYRDALRPNIHTYLTTNEFPELIEATRSVNVRMAALSFVAPKHVQRAAVSFITGLKEWAYFKDIAARFQTAGNIQAAEATIQGQAWGRGPSWVEFQRTLQEDAGFLGPPPDPRTLMELMAGITPMRSALRNAKRA